jgi:coenzyme F420-reducing hydrogenase delta subunit
MRVPYDPGVAVVGVPCTGAIEAAVVLGAFEEGADGVFVAGCLDGECRYKEGNLRARERVAGLQKRLAEVGLEPGRLEMYQLSAAMGTRFGEIVAEFVGRIKALPPSRLGRGAAVKGGVPG